jgi:hypothetical protein
MSTNSISPGGTGTAESVAAAGIAKLATHRAMAKRREGMFVPGWEGRGVTLRTSI